VLHLLEAHMCLPSWVLLCGEDMQVYNCSKCWSGLHSTCYEYRFSPTKHVTKSHDKCWYAHSVYINENKSPIKHYRDTDWGCEWERNPSYKKEVK
jgi:hypothetical protein